MEQFNRIIATLMLVVGMQSYSGNSMQLYRRIVRQYGHPPFEQIILKPTYQLIHPHRPYHPIIKYDETPVHSNPHAYHHYDPSFSEQPTLFHPIPNPNLFQPLAVHPNHSKPPPPPKLIGFYPSNFYFDSFNQHKLPQNPYFQTATQPQAIRYSKPKVKPEHEYHNPSQHYIPQPHHHHHQRYQNDYRDDETAPPQQISKDHGKEVSTKHITNMKSVKTMSAHNTEQGDEDVDEEPLERPDVSKTTGPVFTYVKTDPNANIKWGVRHYVGNKYN